MLWASPLILVSIASTLYPLALKADDRSQDLGRPANKMRADFEVVGDGEGGCCLASEG